MNNANVRIPGVCTTKHAAEYGRHRARVTRQNSSYSGSGLDSRYWNEHRRPICARAPKTEPINRYCHGDGHGPIVASSTLRIHTGPAWYLPGYRALSRCYEWFGQVYSSQGPYYILLSLSKLLRCT